MIGAGRQLDDVVDFTEWRAFFAFWVNSEDASVGGQQCKRVESCHYLLEGWEMKNRAVFLAGDLLLIRNDRHFVYVFCFFAAFGQLPRKYAVSIYVFDYREGVFADQCYEVDGALALKFDLEQALYR